MLLPARITLRKDSYLEFLFDVTVGVGLTKMMMKIMFQVFGLRLPNNESSHLLRYHTCCAMQDDVVLESHLVNLFDHPTLLSLVFLPVCRELLFRGSLIHSLSTYLE